MRRKAPSTSQAVADLAIAGFVRNCLDQLREWWRPLLSAAMLCLAIVMFGPNNHGDRRLSDRLLVSQKLPADPKFLIIEINGEDIRRYGGPPFSREGLVLLFDRLAKGNPQRVLLDTFLAEPFDNATDRKLAQTFSRLGPERLGIVSSPGPRDMPYDLFARQARVVDARLTADQDGWHRRIGDAKRYWGINAAGWLATGKPTREPVNLDLRIATRGYERRSAHEVITGDVRLEGRLIVVSTSTSVAPSRAFLPFTSNADRGAVLALGAQSVRNDFMAISRVGSKVMTVLQVLAVALAFGCALLARSSRSLAVMGGSAAALMALLMLITGRIFAVEVAPVSMLSCFAVMINVTLIQRLKLLPMLASFLKGDISPDEAWAWRSCEKSVHPVVLLSADGTIKRANARAQELVEQFGSRLVPLLSPRAGERVTKVTLGKADEDEAVYHVDWPYAQIAIAILRDDTEATHSDRELRRQLLTDDLTGQLNRRGFDFALERAAHDKSGYGVFFLDMNGFKAVNDTHGHDAGDELLVHSAERLAALLRSSDSLARLGGDEFAIIVPRALSKLDAERLSRRLVSELEIPVELGCAGAVVRVSAAIGFAQPDYPGEDTARVLRRADQAMYRNKAESKIKRAA